MPNDRIGLLVLRDAPINSADILARIEALIGTGLPVPPQAEPVPLPVPAPTSPELAERAIQIGMQLNGLQPYHLGGRCGRVTFDCRADFDCSSFVNWCFHHAGATWNLPQTGLLANNLPRVARDNVRRGDIMVMAVHQGDWASVEGAHTGIWLGDGNLLQCGSQKNGIGVWPPVPGWPFVFVRGA